MAAVIGLTLPAMQLVCHLVAANVNSSIPTADQPPLLGQTQPLPEGYVAYPDIGVAYKVYDVPVLYSIDARNRCAQEGAQLAVVDTFKKVEYLMRLMPSSEQWMHAGIIRVDDRWINLNTGVIVPSMPWGLGEPSRNGDRSYIHRSNKGLEDWGNVNKHHYACELPVLPNNHLIAAN